MKKETLIVTGMSCTSCADSISREVRKLKGVKQAYTRYSTGKLEVTYNPNKVSHEEIEDTVVACGYRCKNPNQALLQRVLIILILFVGIMIVQNTIGIMTLVNAIPIAQGDESLIMLFVIGLLTSFHCIAMCGGLVLSQTIKRDDTNGGQHGKRQHSKPKLEPVENLEEAKSSKFETLKPSILYNAGRVISYTVIGGIVGTLGAVFNMSLTIQGWIQIIGGVFMVIMGLNLLNVFPWLRKLNLRMPKFLALKVRKSKRGKGPFYVGLANGLMPCGPLQAMQLFALATGSPIQGALSMLVFSLGTIPLMFAVGVLSSILSKKLAGKITAVGAVLVMLMGVTMLNRGMSLSGINLFSSGSDNVAVSEVVGDVQVVQTTLSERWEYESISVQVGIPVKWTIYVPDGNLTGCNNPIVLPEWDLEVTLSVGENLIEFTPTEIGTFQYMCWMGMIRSNIFVIN